MITRVGHGKWINSLVFVLKLQENKIKAYFAFTKQPLVLFHSHFSVYLFYLRYYLNKQLSGRDIICVPNALFISDRDFVQSFESRHGRHGNSNLVILFVSERNNHCSRIIKYKRNKQTNKQTKWETLQGSTSSTPPPKERDEKKWNAKPNRWWSITWSSSYCWPSSGSSTPGFERRRAGRRGDGEEAPGKPSIPS